MYDHGPRITGHGPRNSRRPLGNTGLFCHPLGFGCYRVSDGNSVHESALRAYLERGGNLIDTSANYTDGQAEVLVGKVIQNYRRRQVIVVTKGGYIQGSNMQLARRRNFPEVVRYGEGLWHCIHPEFLETQVELSRQRLQLETIDVFLLHNPEYFLNDRAHQGAVSDRDRDEFYRRVREAFRFLEQQVEKERIRWYGISSNNYPLPQSDPTQTSVGRCLDLALGLSANHHFRVVQLPLNLYENGGALERNNDGKTVLEFCRDARIGVLANRPLNAFSSNQMIRLADFSRPGQTRPTEMLDQILQPIDAHEAKLRAYAEVTLLNGPDGGTGQLLRQVVAQLQAAEQWDQVAGHYVVEPIRQWVAYVRRVAEGQRWWEPWIGEFIRLINTAFEEIPRYLMASQQRTSDQVRQRLERAGYRASDQSLSQMALNVAASLPGLSCVLCGMRRPEYVDDAMAVAELERVDGLGILSLGDWGLGLNDKG